MPNDLYRDVFDHASDAILIHRIDGSIVEANRAVCRAMGMTREQLLGSNVYTLPGMHGLEAMSNTIEELKTKGHGVFEIKIPNPGREDVHLEIHISMLRSPEGPLILSMGRDVTAQRRMEEMLIKSQKLEAVGTLAGGIAHDFNNIMTIILGNISAAKIDSPSGSRQFARLNAAEKGIGRAKGLTQQLLTFSEGGDPVKKVVPMADLINGTIPLLVSGSNVLLEMDVPDDLGYASVDEGQIAQVLGVIAINSIEAMPGGGRLHVEARSVSLAEGERLGLANGKYVRIAMSDNGPGIPKSILSNIFEPYITTKKKGSGLGLSIAHSIVRKHGGSIEVCSEVGSGAEFVILLPAAGPPSFPHAEVRLGARILILDDEEAILEVTGEILRHLGYEVNTAADGQEALDMYRESMLEGRPFDLVIMDLTIPGGMGGREVIKHLLVLDPKAKAIVSSGYSNDPVMSDYKGHGFVGVVPKPYHLEELEETVRSSLAL